MNNIKVRFAPSPTGDIHIGNIRVALFNWLFARKKKGKFLLRVEDTDKSRNSTEATNRIFDYLNWLGIKYEKKVFFQSQQEEKHKKIANFLLEKDFAYKAKKGDGEVVFLRIPYNNENLDFIELGEDTLLNIHPQAELIINHKGVHFSLVNKNKKIIPQEACLAGFSNLKVFDPKKKCLFELNQEKIKEIIHKKKEFKIAHASQLKFTRKFVSFTDQIKGYLKKPLDSLKDFVLIKSDGSPLFHLANVCDDISQEITHIIRGDDHIDNTYRHLFIFAALNSKIPSYAHLPMIVNKQGKPYSKRDGDAFVGDFKDKGYLPEALNNFLVLLGWSPKNNREKLNLEEVISLFSLKDIKQTATQFNIDKLYHLNGLYMSEMEEKKFSNLVYEFIITHIPSIKLSKKSLFFEKVSQLMQDRTKVLSECKNWDFFFQTPYWDYNEPKKLKIFSNPQTKQSLEFILKNLKNNEKKDYSSTEWQKLLEETAETLQLSKGVVNKGLRLVVSGHLGGADLTNILHLLKKNTVIERIQKFLQENIKSLP